jgi:hypothetical protein
MRRMWCRTSGRHSHPIHQNHTSAIAAPMSQWTNLPHGVGAARRVISGTGGGVTTVVV